MCVCVCVCVCAEGVIWRVRGGHSYRDSTWPVGVPRGLLLTLPHQERSGSVCRLNKRIRSLQRGKRKRRRRRRRRRKETGKREREDEQGGHMGGDRETGKGKNKGKEENKEKKIRELKEEENKRGGKEEWEDIAKRRRISLEQWGGGSQQRTHTHTHTHTHTLTAHHSAPPHLHCRSACPCSTLSQTRLAPLAGEVTVFAQLITTNLSLREHRHFRRPDMSRRVWTRRRPSLG